MKRGLPPPLFVLVLWSNYCFSVFPNFFRMSADALVSWSSKSPCNTIALIVQSAFST